MLQSSSTLAVIFVVISALLVPAAWTLSGARQDAPPEPPTHPLWEYKVVGLADIHGSTLDYLKGALERSEGGVLGIAKAADDQLALKTQDLLNALGLEGWELLVYEPAVLIFMRPLAR